MKFKVVALIVFVVALSTLGSAQTFGVKKRTPKPDEYGTVVISNYAARVDSDPMKRRSSTTSAGRCRRHPICRLSSFDS